jgi:hypothetical protein
VEVFQGPVLGPSRILGLGGAYAGLAEGVDGVTSNIAAPGVRAPYSAHHVEFDVTASIYFPGTFSSTDFDNRGSLPTNTSVNASDFLYGNAGILVQVGPFGAAFTADLTSFTLGSISFRIVRAHAIAAWGFFGQQLIVGAGISVATMNLISGFAPIAPPSGVGGEGGVLLKLDDQPWRLGVSARSPISGGVGGDLTTNPMTGVKTAGGYIVPQNVVFPAQFEAGFALQLGPRPLNPKWIDPAEDLAPLRRATEETREARTARDEAELALLPEGAVRALRRRELESVEQAIRRVEDAHVSAEEKRIQQAHDARYLNWPRPKVLVVADAVVTAPSSNTVAISSFINRTLESYGRSWTISPRVGLEGEPWLDRFRLRFGSYLEPSLFDGGSARQHFTFGGDFKLLTWDVFGIFPKGNTWQLSFATDFAPRYTNWGVSLGVWH